MFRKVVAYLVELDRTGYRTGDLMKAINDDEDLCMDKTKLLLAIRDGSNSTLFKAYQMVICNESASIKENDTIYHPYDFGKIRMVTKVHSFDGLQVHAPLDRFSTIATSQCSKVIAAYPEIDNIPKLSRDFIQEFVARNGICDLVCEMSLDKDCLDAHNFGDTWDESHYNRPVITDGHVDIKFSNAVSVPPVMPHKADDTFWNIDLADAKYEAAMAIFKAQKGKMIHPDMISIAVQGIYLGMQAAQKTE